MAEALAVGADPVAIVAAALAALASCLVYLLFDKVFGTNFSRTK